MTELHPDLAKGFVMPVSQSNAISGRRQVTQLGDSDVYYLEIPVAVTGHELEALADELAEPRPIWPPKVLGLVLRRMTFAASSLRAEVLR